MFIATDGRSFLGMMLAMLPMYCWGEIAFLAMPGRTATVFSDEKSVPFGKASSATCLKNNHKTLPARHQRGAASGSSQRMCGAAHGGNRWPSATRAGNRRDKTPLQQDWSHQCNAHRVCL